jgi:mycothiol synthase
MTIAQLPEGYSVRAATMEDVDAVTNLFNDVEIDEAGEPEYSPGEVAEEWSDLDLRERAALVEASNGTLAGCLVLKSRGNVVHDADIYVHPSHTLRGIGAYLINLSEARAQSWVDGAPKGKRVVIRNAIHAPNQAANNLLKQYAYEPIRHFWRMEIVLESEPIEPAFPEGFTVRPCRSGQDEHAVYAIVDETFQDHWSFGPTSFEDWFGRTGFDPNLTFQLFEGDEVIGVIVCRIYGGDLGWVGDLGIRKPWRRRGLGLALLQFAFAEFYRRGIRRVALGVDAQNEQGATQLYDRAGMKITRNFVIYEKELRPGEPWEG